MKTALAQLIEDSQNYLDISKKDFDSQSESFQKKVGDVYLQIISSVNTASDAYYRGEDSGMSDETYDKLMDTLRTFEAKGILPINSDSPTQKVNGGTSDDKIRHVTPMLSLRDIFNMQSLREWVEPRSTSWCVEPKIDGLSVEFVYQDGKFKGAYTRGNGYEGEDVTPVVSKMECIPKNIEWRGLLAVRGEVYMTKRAFDAYNRDVCKAANPRNLSVGLIKRKNDSETGGRYLSAFIFNLQKIEASEYDSVLNFDLSRHIEQLNFLRRLGFPAIHSRWCSDWDAVDTAVRNIEEVRPQLDYNIDGAVIKSDSMGYRQSVGDDGAVPRWAVAYKYPAVQQETRVLDITYQLGKTGKLTPVAILEPIEVDGSVISRCTLHNKNRMKDLDIRIGDMVKLHKSGDVIPKITEARHTADSQEFSYPETCPVCGAELDDEYCRNEFCPNKTQSKLYNWVSKGGLDAPGVSGSLVSALIERNMISTPADFYKLKPADLYKLPKMGSTKVTKTLRAIDETRKRPLARVIVGLCIDGVGGAAATKLADYARTWDNLMSLTQEKCVQLIGGCAGRKFYAAIQEKYYKDLISELKHIFPFK